MKSRFLAGLAFIMLALLSCDDTTETIGTSLTNDMDYLQISTDTFNVTTRSIVADSVLSRSNTGYVGKIKDPETGLYITGDFMAQFHALEGQNGYLFPKLDSIVSRINGEVIADSCELRLYYSTFYGDSLSTMTLTAREMSKPMEENVNYYSNFDPVAQGFVRTNGIAKQKTYTLSDLSVRDSIRLSSNYWKNIRIMLNDEYTDTEGNTYNNYGTFIMRKYFQNPADFDDPHTFIHKVCPGFYFQNTGGLGSMAYIDGCQLSIYFRFHPNDSTTSVGTVTFAGTEEVLQTTHVSNDKGTLRKLVDDNTCTYIKTPAGIFTEMTIPVDEIVNNHKNDTLSTAKIILSRISNESHTGYELDVPSYLLMVQKDSLYSFFENSKLHNNRTSFLSPRDSYTDSYGNVSYYNTYTFNNISNLVRYMAEAKANGGANYAAQHPNWNKVVLVPVTVSTTTNSNRSTVYNKIVNDMSLTSTRLVGGDANSHSPMRMSVVYSKFNKQ